MRRLGLLALLSLAGCGTIVDMADDQRVYGGTRFVGERVGEGFSLGMCGSLGPLWLIDLPLSLAADTILIPVTVTIALTRPNVERSTSNAERPRFPIQ